MIKQTKGKALDKIAQSCLPSDTDIFLVTTKYDGNYIQIHKSGIYVRFYTSGGKEFYWQDVALEFIDRFDGVDFIVEGEYIADTNGKLGSRTKCSTGTARANFTKGIVTNLGSNSIKLFDILEYNSSTECMPTNTTAYDRTNLLIKHFSGFTNFISVCVPVVMTLSEAIDHTKVMVNDGWEGTFLKATNHTLHAGKRVNNAIKLKYRKTADLFCVGVTDGEGKYKGMIGSLKLIDSKCRVVDVGSGLDDSDRVVPHDTYIGKVIEITYEQLIDTYIQPTLDGDSWLRLDKTVEDID
jgi:ATP-dependent DNA ligase